jgi:DNA-binding LacI/PurR family transcriptional regulator
LEVTQVTKASNSPITLNELATALELSQSTVSRIVNGAGATHRIAKLTQERVLHAAALHGYSANVVV